MKKPKSDKKPQASTRREQEREGFSYARKVFNPKWRCSIIAATCVGSRKLKQRWQNESERGIDHAY